MILLYGGTFNPIHYGHIIPLQNLAHQLNPDRLIYIPCHLPPHKDVPSVSGQEFSTGNEKPPYDGCSDHANGSDALTNETTEVSVCNIYDGRLTNI